MRVAVLAVGFVVFASASAAATGTQRPTLRLITLTPLTIQGKAFKPNEKVELLVSAGKPLRVFVRAGTLGGFRFAFKYRVPRCTSVSIQAIGARGSRALYSLDQPDCAPIPG